MASNEKAQFGADQIARNQHTERIATKTAKCRLTEADAAVLQDQEANARRQQRIEHGLRHERQSNLGKPEPRQSEAASSATTPASSTAEVTPTLLGFAELTTLCAVAVSARSRYAGRAPDQDANHQQKRQDRRRPRQINRTEVMNLSDKDRGNKRAGKAAKAANDNDDERLDKNVIAHRRRQRQQRTGNHAREPCQRRAETDHDKAQPVDVDAPGST